MTKREIAMNAARYAGYHEDTATYTRLVCESRVNFPKMQEAFQQGRQARANGMRCGCPECKVAPEEKAS